MFPGARWLSGDDDRGRGTIASALCRVATNTRKFEAVNPKDQLKDRKERRTSMMWYKAVGYFLHKRGMESGD